METRGVITLEIPGDANEMGPNKRIHWRSQITLKKKWRQRAAFVACDALNRMAVQPIRGRAVVSWVIRRGRRLDADNAASSGALKHILDGLVDAGLLQGDCLKFCERGSVDQETGKEYRDRPSVLVCLEPLE